MRQDLVSFSILSFQVFLRYFFQPRDSAKNRVNAINSLIKRAKNLEIDPSLNPESLFNTIKKTVLNKKLLHEQNFIPSYCSIEIFHVRDNYSLVYAGKLSDEK